MDVDDKDSRWLADNAEKYEVGDMVRLDYISILAGGFCPKKCSFCAGQYIRKNEPPHFASLEMIDRFINIYKSQTKLLSISGSTSDPLFCLNFENILKTARGKFKEISLHTCAHSILTEIDVKPFSEICISIHKLPNNELIKFIVKHKERIRISAVYHDKNKGIFDNLSFFDNFPCKSFTIRKNIFNPMIPEFSNRLNKIGVIYNQPVYKYKDKEIVIWDFKDANKYINAIYLWSDGLIRKQCYWNNLHVKPKNQK